jgi:hypothetical protein
MAADDEPAGPQEPEDELDDLDGDVGTAAAIDPPEVELLEAGDEPRRALRLDLEEGTEVSATLQFEEEVLTEDDGTPQPPQAGQVELRLTVTAVDAGETTIAFSYDAVAMDGQDGAANPLEGVEGEMVLDDRSRLIATTQSAQGLDQLPIALPEEEVGEGAVWEVRIEGGKAAPHPRGLEGVLQQHRDRHRPDAPGHRGDGARHLGDLVEQRRRRSACRPPCGWCRRR